MPHDDTGRWLTLELSPAAYQSCDSPTRCADIISQHNVQKNIEKTCRILALIALTSLASAGCGQRVAKLNNDQKKAFDDAPAELKQNWDKAIAADSANDYVTAGKLLDDLNKATLSDSQRQALNTERVSFGDRAMKAAEKNDPNAIQALKNSVRTQPR